MKVERDEFFRTLLLNALYVQIYISDNISDMHTIYELDSNPREGFHVEIYYRRTGTWLLNLNTANEENLNRINSLKKNNDFAVEYIKRIDQHGNVQYELSETKCHG